MLIIVFKRRLCLWTTRLRVEVRDPQNREVVVLCVFMCVGCCNTYSSRSWESSARCCTGGNERTAPARVSK